MGYFWPPAKHIWLSQRTVLGPFVTACQSVKDHEVFGIPFESVLRTRWDIYRCSRFDRITLSIYIDNAISTNNKINFIDWMWFLGINIAGMQPQDTSLNMFSIYKISEVAIIVVKFRKNIV